MYKGTFPFTRIGLGWFCGYNLLFISLPVFISHRYTDHNMNIKSLISILTLFLPCLYEYNIHHPWFFLGQKFRCVY